MNPPQFLAQLKRRSVRGLAIAYVIVGLFLIQAAAILLATFEAAAWGMKLLVRSLAPGKVYQLASSIYEGLQSVRD
jgi:hypothetical protein